MDFFDVEFALHILPVILKYVKVTLSLSLLSMLFGLTLAFIISLIIDAKIPIIYRILKTYVSFFRGTPLLVQLFLVYFGLAHVFTSMASLSSFGAACIVMSLNSSAYMSESIRGAILAIDKGQMEASLSVGMTYFQAMRRIILPQAFKVAIPALSNTFINLIKNSSLAFTIGVVEITASAQLEATSSYKYLEAYFDILIIYWIITSALTYLQKKLEERLSHS
ncbi:amino acid ABC transporter permease [Maledivibacter halophilus]|uniref:Amino acid ABC transporter membrane protein, PAAT family (TC 3.A.1.3.-) n=1 Tax=Maledivibacter halophilus TaxID=36842 RepID=A0A1T5M3Z8_9FIRM|nr:amino acid ABC transporter permease [Maledivibacter halophilus]SKC82962.1 amino acid ABC transporter membrane protein, PAAT family (TC 3.A.1.3.-) [Maledivibacter halophilus]